MILIVIISLIMQKVVIPHERLPISHFCCNETENECSSGCCCMKIATNGSCLHFCLVVFVHLTFCYCYLLWFKIIEINLSPLPNFGWKNSVYTRGVTISNSMQ